MKKSIKYGFGVGAATIAAIATPIAIISVNASSDKSVLFQGRRTIILYKKQSSFAGSRNRIWDMSAQAKNMTTRNEYDLQLTTLFKQRVTKSSVVDYGHDGAAKQTQTKQENFVFDGIDSTTVYDQSGTPTSFKDAKSLIDHFKKGNKTKAFTFKVKPGTFYINAKGEKTKYAYKAIDFFYGMMRSIYLSEDVLTKGELAGGIKAVKPVSDAYFAKAKDTKQSDMYDKQGNLRLGYNNGNLYLYNLYGVDLDRTIEDNTGANFNENEFKLYFKEAQSDQIIYNFMSDVNFITPSPSQKIRELNGNYTDDFSLGSSGQPGKFIQLVEFGQLKTNEGKVDLSEQLKVSRYYVTNYDTNPNTAGIVLQKNIHSFDKKFNQANNNIEKFQILIVDDAIDLDVFAQARQKSFLTDNSESILYETVFEKPTLIQAVRKKGLAEFKRLSKGGMTKQGYWNPWFMLQTSETKNRLDSNTTKLLFGQSPAHAITSGEALHEYFMGRGRQFRSLLNASVNLYGITKQWTPGSSEIKSVKNYTNSQLITVGRSLEEDYKDKTNLEYNKTAIEHGIVSDLDQQKWFVKQAQENKSKEELLKPTGDKYLSLQTQWKNFLTKARSDLGLTPEAKFNIPLYDFRYQDDAKEWTKDKISAYKLIVKQLNKLTKGLGINFKEFNSTGTKEANAVRKPDTAPFIYIGIGKDYSSIISLAQQLISAYYSPFPAMAIMHEALLDKNNEVKTYAPWNPNDKQAWDSYELNDKISIKDFIDYLKQDKVTNKDILDIDVVKNINFTDWKNLVSKNTKAIDAKKKAAMNQFDNAFQKFCFLASSDKTKIRKYVRLFTDLSLPYKLALGSENHVSKAAKADAQFDVDTSYTAPWLHLSEPASNSSNELNILDTTVTLK